MRGPQVCLATLAAFPAAIEALRDSGVNVATAPAGRASTLLAFASRLESILHSRS
jgi:hypothetical protein